MFNILPTFVLSAFLILPSLVLLATNASAAMYKQVDKDGNVTYTDVPDKANVKPIKPLPMSTYSAPNLPSSSFSSDSTGERNPASVTPAVVYQSMKISSPEDNFAVRANGGSFSVQVTLEPPLDTKNKHRLVVLVDGEHKAEGHSTSVTVNNVDRGEHTLSAQIVASNGDILIDADDITVTVLRASVGSN